MEFENVTSSNVSQVAYVAETSTLGVRFNNGSEYHYMGVPAQVFEELMAAGSKGSYLDQYVKKAGYSYVRIC